MSHVCPELRCSGILVPGGIACREGRVPPEYGHNHNLDKMANSVVSAEPDRLGADLSDRLHPQSFAKVRVEHNIKASPRS